MHILITGGTNGIGLSAAKSLLQLGHTLHLTYRSKERLNDLYSYLKAINKVDAAFFYKCDISEPDHIKKIIVKFRERKISFDCLINNAGVILFKKSTNSKGIENVFATNHIGGFYLTKLLLEKNLISSEGRIINVGSSAHKKANLDFNDLDSKNTKNWYIRYSRSKLCNLLFTLELSKRLKDKSITVNCMHPGIVNTNIAQEYRGIMQLIVKLVLKINGISPTEGADTLVFLTTDKSVSEVSGKYFIKRKVRSPSSMAVSPEIAKRLWVESERIVTKF